MNPWTKQWRLHVIVVPIVLGIAMLIISQVHKATFAHIVYFFPGFLIGWITAVIAHFVYPLEDR